VASPALFTAARARRPPGGRVPPCAAALVARLAPALSLLAPLAAGAQIGFEDATQAYGIHAVVMTYGPTWGDYTGDGYDDVFIGNHYARQPMLLRNIGGTGLLDRADHVGMPRGGDRHGAAWGDFNNSGWRDLYVAVGASAGQGTGYNQLYMNSYGEHFADVALTAGVVDSLGRGRFPYWIDVDNDGWLDLFVGNEDSPNRLFLNRRDRSFAPLPGAGGLGADGLWIAAWTRWDGDRRMDVALAGSYTHQLRLYRHGGLDGFVDVTAASGLPAQLDWIQSLCWIDYDNDGDQDLYVARGWASDLRDAVLSEEARLSFLFHMPREREMEDGLDGVAFHCAADTLDLDVQINSTAGPERIFLGAALEHPPANPFTLVDGRHIGRPPFVAGAHLGCYIWQEEAGGPWFVHCSTDFAFRQRFGAVIEARGASITAVEWTGLEAPACPEDLGDRLYENLGDGTFRDATQAAGIDNPGSSRTAIAADFDNDGFLDLYVVNERDPRSLIAVNQANCLWRNNGDGTFTEMAAACGVDARVPGTGAGAAWGDVNADGFPDIYLTNGWSEFPFCLGPHKLYRNLGNAHHWLKVRLEGRSSNRDGIGALVRAVAGDLTQTRVQAGGVNDMAQSTMDLIFGLGEAALVDTLSIHWPSGIVETHTGLGADQTLLFVEPESGSAPLPDGSPTGPLLALLCPSPARDGAAIHYRLARPARVQAEICDAAGRLLRSLHAGRQSPGERTLLWDGRDALGRAAAPGVYFVRLAADGERRERTIVLTR